MRLTRIAIALMLCSAIVLTIGCGRQETSTAQEQQVATVQRGNLTLDITAIGNLALSQKENLAFEIDGTVEDVLVEEGDFVEEGDVLAELDSSGRLDYLNTLERQIETKERELLQAEINVENAEAALSEVNSPEYISLATAQAELEVANAEIALANAQSAYDTAKTRYDNNWTVAEFTRNYEQKKAQLAIAEAKLADAEDTLAQVPDDIAQERENKQKELTIVQSKLEEAQTALEDADEALEEAQVQNYTITAPFDGFITKVNISDGSEVKQGTTAIEIADPNQFEADIMVSEMDIFQVEVGIEATVQVESAQSIILPAEVVRIAPTATIQSGVVNYEVKVAVSSLETIAEERQGMMERAMEDIASGELPEMLQRAVEEGRLTEEQAREMLEQMQSGDFPSPQEGFEGRTPFAEGEIPEMPEGFEGQMPFSGGGVTSGTANVSSEDFQLREGLTVTVTIITEQRNDVLLVPNAAINTRVGKNYVTIVLADDTTEEREIQVGISDWQYTEATSGLSEGEQVFVPEGTTTTNTGPQGGFMFQGMGR